MDPLTQQLLQRQLAQSQPVPVVPPNPTSHVPPKMKRWENAQAIQDAYRSGWATNPVLLQASLGK